MIANSRSTSADGQRRRRLVHDQDARRRRTAPWRSRRAGAGRSTRSPTRRSASMCDVRRRRAASRASRRMRRAVEAAARPRQLAAEEQVGGHVEPRHEVELLEDRGDAGRLGLARAGEAHRRAVDRGSSPSSGAMHAGEDVHQRRLAGAVLAEERVDLAGLQVEVDAAQRLDAAEALLDAAHLEERLSHGPGTRTTRGGGRRRGARSPRPAGRPSSAAAESSRPARSRRRQRAGDRRARAGQPRGPLAPPAPRSPARPGGCGRGRAARSRSTRPRGGRRQRSWPTPRPVMTGLSPAAAPPSRVPLGVTAVPLPGGGSRGPEPRRH